MLFWIFLSKCSKENNLKDQVSSSHDEEKEEFLSEREDFMVELKTSLEALVFAEGELNSIAVEEELLGTFSFEKDLIMEDKYLIGGDDYLIGEDEYLMGYDNYLMGEKAVHVESSSEKIIFTTEGPPSLPFEKDQEQSSFPGKNPIGPCNSSSTPSEDGVYAENYLSESFIHAKPRFSELAIQIKQTFSKEKDESEELTTEIVESPNSDKEDKKDKADKEVKENKEDKKVETVIEDKEIKTVIEDKKVETVTEDKEIKENKEDKEVEAVIDDKEDDVRGLSLTSEEVSVKPKTYNKNEAHAPPSNTEEISVKSKIYNDSFAASLNSSNKLKAPQSNSEIRKEIRESFVKLLETVINLIKRSEENKTHLRNLLFQGSLDPSILSLLSDFTYHLLSFTPVLREKLDLVEERFMMSHPYLNFYASDLHEYEEVDKFLEDEEAKKLVKDLRDNLSDIYFIMNNLYERIRIYLIQTPISH